MSRILLVEDEAAIADTLVYALGQSGHVVEHCLTGRDASRRLDSGMPDLVILDVGLPDVSGFQWLGQLRQRSALPVLMLTARSDEIDRVLGFELGADDYVVKPFSPREVVARVAAILKRAQGVRPPELPAVLRLDEVRARVTCAGVPLELTRYEYLLMQVLMRHPERVYSRTQLMDMIWTHEASQERTVDTHVKSLRMKIKAQAPDADPIQTHRGLGYSFRPS